MWAQRKENEMRVKHGVYTEGVVRCGLGGSINRYFPCAFLLRRLFLGSSRSKEFPAELHKLRTSVGLGTGKKMLERLSCAVHVFVCTSEWLDEKKNELFWDGCQK